MVMWKLWLLTAGLFLIIEIFTTGFLVFWFAVGALIAMIASFFIANMYVQMTVFLISSTILLFATRGFAESVQKNTPTIQTNVYSLEGKTGKVIEDIVPVDGTGKVKIEGEVWTAKSFNDMPIPNGTNVQIERIEGVKVIVKPIY